MNCGQCGKDFLKLSQKKYFCSRECTSANTRKNLPPRTCEGCDIDMSKENPIKKFCTIECQRLYKSIEKFTGIEGVDYIVCPVCKMRTRQFSPPHAKMHGFDSIQSFCSFYKIKSTCEAKCELSKGENNPAYNHGGKYSPFSKNFVKGYDEEWHNNNKKQMSEKMKARNHLNKFSIEYWLIETDGDEAKANELYSKHQTRDVSWFIEKYGEEEGLIRHKAKTEKWMKSFKSQSYSKVSQTLFNEIKQILLMDYGWDDDDIYFAEHDHPDMVDYKNKEYFLRTETSYVRPDFLILSKKRIIEFDGDYWHSEEKYNSERERIRDEKIIKVGYEILHVQENKYNKNKEMVIEQCIKFLTQ